LLEMVRILGTGFLLAQQIHSTRAVQGNRETSQVSLVTFA